MERSRKFGTFGGVFTPSLLTILGVIMYLRLGWIVGQAGLYTVLGIILIAHVISITTGLSLSAIATDKKIKAGGIYYMLSRSLGLAMGGAIGATIYMAMALSISFYIVGFSESFLALDSIQALLPWGNDIQSIRLTGSIVLVLLTIIAIISTSLAIKIQYLVLSVIALSLVSIFWGLLSSSSLQSSAPILGMAANAPSPEVLFAIFFPAVTGFTVGVAMSGDLKNPNVSIPKGTLLAIFTGLLIYLSMAIGFAIFADRETLLTDTSFTITTSRFPLMVIAGIWGATLSSALGSILGGPRIVQAMAGDRLAPSALHKGFGKNNEPRIAILFTFIIAMGGILIGDLNAIARVVAMFFITAYGFINLAFALESWASTDFRPAFRTPRWVGWLGFFASILVMMQIDLLAMLVAFLLIWLTWYIMKKRERQLETNDDVWQSVWASVVRHSLHKMDNRSIEERNWKPNIMLFSGNPNTRPHLVELGKALIANHGLLTIINLKVFQGAQKSYSRFRQTSHTPESLEDKGIFSREYYCSDIYQGIENLAETYGFAGVEPNTVFMGWARQDTDPVRFARLIRHITELDLNILLMDFDSQREFGQRRLIDIWWRGSGNNGNLAINLVKFLWLSDQWKDSRMRLMIENPINDERENIYSFAREVLDTLRVNAQIVIINNEIEKKPFYDIIRAESADSDIIFLGLPDFEEGQEAEFVEQTHALCADLGTVVLIKASTQFKRLNIGLKSKPLDRLAQFPESDPTHIKHIRWPANPQSTAFAKEFYRQTSELSHEMRSQAFGKVLYQFADILNNSRTRVNTTFSLIEKKLSEQQPELNQVMFKLTGNTFSRYEQILLQLRDQLLTGQQKALEVYQKAFTKKAIQLLVSLPEKITIDLDYQSLQPLPDDSLYIRIFKWSKRFRIKVQATEKIRIRKLVKTKYPQAWYSIQQKLWQKFSSLSMQYVIEQQKAFKQLRDSLHIIETAMERGTFTPDMLTSERQKVEDIFASLRIFLHEAEKEFHNLTEEANNRAIQDICDVLNHVCVNAYIPRGKRVKRIRRSQIRAMEAYPATWSQKQRLQINHNLLEVTLSSVEYKVWKLLDRATAELQELAHPQGRQGLLMAPGIIADFTLQAMEKIDRQEPVHQPEFRTLPAENIYRSIKDIEDDTLEKINQALSRLPSHAELLRGISSTDLISLRAEGMETEKMEVSRLINYVIQNDLIGPLQQHLRSFSKQLSQLDMEILEISRLIRITLTGDKEDVVHLPDKYFFAEQHERALQALRTLEDLNVSIADRLRNIFNNTAGQLSPAVFLKTAENLKLYAKGKEKQEREESWIRRKANQLRDHMRRQLVKIWFDRSKRIVFAYRSRLHESENYLPVGQIHAVNEEVSVKENLLLQIPPYYQQLFLRKNNFFMDFWHGKSREMEEARKIINRHEKGFNGALLIRGEHNSGKTFMANYICHRYLANRPIFVLQPPFAGSASAGDFLRVLQKATERPLTVQKLMKSLPDKSVIVIEDLELWWEKQTDGLKVIQLICGLIEKYGARVLFIINVNLHAFNSISRFKRLDPWLLGTITCHPFHAEELRNIIMQRHGSGNMKFVYDGKKENEMRSWDYARLFNTYFNYTRGNVGLALQTWMASIQEVKNNQLHIVSPRRPDLSALNKLQAEHLIFLVQFILHKRLNLEKIQRIMLFNAEEAREKIMQLKRAALVTEPHPGVFMLNPNLHAFIRERLIEKELL